MTRRTILALLVLLCLGLVVGTNAHAQVYRPAQQAAAYPATAPNPYDSTNAQVAPYAQPQPSGSPSANSSPPPIQGILQTILSTDCNTAGNPVVSGIDAVVTAVVAPGITIGGKSYNLAYNLFIIFFGVFLVLWIFRVAGPAQSWADILGSWGTQALFAMLLLLVMTAAGRGFQGQPLASMQAESFGSKLADMFNPSSGSYNATQSIGAVVGNGVCRSFKIVSVPSLALISTDPISQKESWDPRQLADIGTVLLYAVFILIALVPALFCLVAHLIIAAQLFFLHINAYLLAPAITFTLAFSLIPAFKDYGMKFVGLLWLITIGQLTTLLTLAIINTLFNSALTQMVNGVGPGNIGGLIFILLELVAFGIIGVALAIASPQFAKMFAGQLADLGAGVGIAGGAAALLGGVALGATVKLAAGAVSKAVAEAKAKGLDKEVRVHGDHHKTHEATRDDKAASKDENRLKDSRQDENEAPQPVSAPEHREDHSPQATQPQGEEYGNEYPTEGADQEHSYGSETDARESLDAAATGVGAQLGQFPGLPADNVAALQRSLRAASAAYERGDGAAASEHLDQAQQHLDALKEAPLTQGREEDHAAALDRSQELIDGARGSVDDVAGTDAAGPLQASEPSITAPNDPMHDNQQRLDDAIESVMLEAPTGAVIRELKNAASAATHRPAPQREAIHAIANAMDNVRQMSPKTKTAQTQVQHAQAHLGNALHAVRQGDHAGAKVALKAAQQQISYGALSTAAPAETQHAGKAALDHIGNAFTAIGADAAAGAASATPGVPTPPPAQVDVQTTTTSKATDVNESTTTGGGTSSAPAGPPDRITVQLQRLEEAFTRTSTTFERAAETLSSSAAGQDLRHQESIQQRNEQFAQQQIMAERNLQQREDQFNRSLRRQKWMELRQRLEQAAQQAAMHSGGHGQIQAPHHNVIHPSEKDPLK
jgi:hypothetical protein